MFTKWKIDVKGMENYRFAENGDLYKLPFIDSAGKHRELRRIKKLDKNRYVINGRYWSQTQLRPHLRIDDDPIELFKANDLPF